MKSTETTNENMAVRSLKTGVLAALMGTLWSCFVGHPNWGWGFLAGSLLSLFSLFSLTVVIPFLLRPGASRISVALLLITLVMKIPFYIICLYLAVRLSGNSPLSALAGLILAPTVITLKTVGGLITAKQSLRVPRPVVDRRERVVSETTYNPLPAHAPARPLPVARASEGG